MITWDSQTHEGSDPSSIGTHGSRVPSVVVVTITNICNMKCPQCAYPHLRPKKTQHMSFSVISKIVSECAEMGVATIRILGLAEPTLHPLFYDFLELFMENENLSLHVFTNGSSLTQRGIQWLLKSPPNILEVSIDAFSHSSYQLIRGGSQSLFQRVCEGTKQYAIELREGRDKKRWGSNYPISRVSFVLHPETKMEVSQFAVAWKDYVDEVRFRVPHDFNGFAHGLPSQVEIREFEVREVSCNFIPSRLYVDVEGAIHACADDFKNQFILGNMQRDAALMSAWNHASRLNLLNAHSSNKGIPSACNRCHRRQHAQVSPEILKNLTTGFKD